MRTFQIYYLGDFQIYNIVIKILYFKLVDFIEEF